MRSLNLDQLRAFVEVVERGSFTAAARELNLTQPAVTHQIQERARPSSSMAQRRRKIPRSPPRVRSFAVSDCQQEERSCNPFITLQAFVISRLHFTCRAYVALTRQLEG
jgi:hypothetical protein